MADWSDWLLVRWALKIRLCKESWDPFAQLFPHPYAHLLISLPYAAQVTHLWPLRALFFVSRGLCSKQTKTIPSVSPSNRSLQYTMYRFPKQQDITGERCRLGKVVFGGHKSVNLMEVVSCLIPSRKQCNSVCWQRGPKSPGEKFSPIFKKKQKTERFRDSSLVPIIESFLFTLWARMLGAKVLKNGHMLF